MENQIKDTRSKRIWERVRGNIIFLVTKMHLIHLLLKNMTWNPYFMVDRKGGFSSSHIEPLELNNNV